MPELRISRIPSEYIDGINKIAEKKGVSVSYIKRILITRIVDNSEAFKKSDNKELKIPNVSQSIVNKFEQKCKSLGMSRRTVISLEIKRFIEEHEI